MSDEELLTIGVFALVSGLSINALRYYGELGLLKPAFVDPSTGYRRYQPQQVHQARMICALHGVDMPIDAVRQAMDDPDSEAVRALLHCHRQRLVDRTQALSRLIRVVDHYLEHGVTMPGLKTPRIVQVTINVTDLAEAIAFYRAAFGPAYNEEVSSFIFGVWPSDDFFMLTVAGEAGPDGARREHRGPDGRSRFGLLVSDAGATEFCPPEDKPWKPRSSCVIGPSGTLIDLYQG